MLKIFFSRLSQALLANKCSLLLYCSILYIADISHRLQKNFPRVGCVKCGKTVLTDIQRENIYFSLISPSYSMLC